ncbi:hypothetical protein [Achromobacter insuavis]|uniref:hypothetical protein n=1 Tax=Achromobacter insuavis TaxID=1287735 RepID=UPI0035A1CCFA
MRKPSKRTSDNRSAVILGAAIVFSVASAYFIHRSGAVDDGAMARVLRAASVPREYPAVEITDARTGQRYLATPRYYPPGGGAVSPPAVPRSYPCGDQPCPPDRRINPPRD